MTFHPDKCKVMAVKNKCRSFPLPFYDYVESEKDTEVTLNLENNSGVKICLWSWLGGFCSHIIINIDQTVHFQAIQNLISQNMISLQCNRH